MKKKMKLFAILLSLQTAFVSAESIRDFESFNLKLSSFWDSSEAPKKHNSPVRHPRPSTTLRINSSGGPEPAPDLFRGSNGAWIPAFAGMTEQKNQVLTPPTSTPSANAKKDDWKKDWLLHGLAGLFIAYQFADLYTTYEALDRGAHEANPIMKWPIAHPPVAVAIKFGIAGFYLNSMYQARKDGYKRMTRIHLTVMNLLYTAVIANNLYVISKYNNR